MAINRLLSVSVSSAAPIHRLLSQRLTRSTGLGKRGFSARISSFSTSTTATSNNVFNKITFLGAGKMSQAMISPLISQHLQTPESITAYDVSKSALAKVQSTYPGVQTAKSIPEAITDSNLIVYGVKPQNLDKVHGEIRRTKLEGAGRVRDDAILLSIVAGMPIQHFVDGSLVPRVVRSMPNTPAQIGAGVTVWSCTGNIDADERTRVRAILESFGESVFVDDESFIDMSTAISGSGPAYVFMLMEAMVDAGVHMGFSRGTATTLVHHTLLGSTKFAMETQEHPAVLRNNVTSPAGTTASAIYELENGKFRTVIKDAIWACYRRSLEMGGQCSQVGPTRAPMPTAGESGRLGNGDGASKLAGGSHHQVAPPIGEMRVPSSFGNTHL